MKLQLSLGFSRNPRSAPILSGRIQPDGIELVPNVVEPAELFWRQLRFAQFDVSEMSFSSLMLSLAKGDDRFIAMPIFTTRRFFHTTTLVRRDAGIEQPRDLKGKRVGVFEYQMTAALWTRGILQHEFGVEPREMEFWMERTSEHSHGGATGFVPPPGVTVHQIAADRNIGSMMLAGELDASLVHFAENAGRESIIDRTRVDLMRQPEIKTLYPDPLAEGVRYFRKTGLYPVNHVVVIKRAIATQHPWSVLNLYKAFEQASQLADRERMAHVEYHLAAGLLPPQAAGALATGASRYGIAANRRLLETAAQYSHEQGLTPRLMRLEEIFAPSVMDQ